MSPMMAPGSTPTDLDEDDLPDGYDVVGGELVERSMGATSSWIGGEFHALLRDFCRTHRLGWVWPSDGGFKCFPHKPKLVRYPDVGFVRYGRLPGEVLPTGHIPVAPDLAVEVVSPRDHVEALEEKVLDYRAAEVPLVWVIYPTLRTARVYRPDGTTTEIPADGVLDGEGVVPGFRVRVADLFPPANPVAAAE